MTDEAIAECIFALLAARRPGATICPSEVARALAPGDGPWRACMPRIRAVAQTLVQQGRLCVTRGGRAVDPARPAGPIRLGLPPGHGAAADGAQR